MNSFPEDVDETPERPLSELCMNLEDKFASVQDVSKGDNLNVYVRIRPMLDSEIEAGYKECIGLINKQIVRAVAPANSSKFKMTSHLCQDIMEDFTFTAAYGPQTGQFELFQECMMDTMKNFIEGQNSLVFSYGTTGSGKTFTMQGDADNPGLTPLSLHLFFASVEDQLLDKVFFKPDKFSSVVALNDNEIKKELEIKEQLFSACNQEEWSFKNSSTQSLGMLLCQTFSDHFVAEECQTTLGPEEMAQSQAAALMKEISKKSAGKQSGYCSIFVSFVEIYNENIFDLLQPNSNERVKLSLGEDKNGDVYVKGLREVCVSNSYEALSLLNFGQKNLRIASTKLNYQSSRSHCIFTIKVIRIPDPENMSYAKVNRLSFCDLAGSERAAKSQTTGLRLKEAGSINTSLLVLGRCLDQLRLNPSLRDKKMIPFRESKLTRLFSGFFIGRGKAVMITNASPCELTFDETRHVFRFSAIAKELIINDNYITTASNTLQSIANMWTDAKTNCKNQSQSSESISFEDSMDDVNLDEIIEKLLDIAESLRDNLQQEKKEKAELKIRLGDCDEYSEYRDELLEWQKHAFEEEKGAIKQIYEKRISMEQRYEKIITDFQTQGEESLSSDGEESMDPIATPSLMNVTRQSEVGENSFTNENSENADSHPKSNNIVETKDLRKTEQELQKTVNYSLSLEVELEHSRKQYENMQLLLENTMKENDDTKRELDAWKIDVIALRADNESLLKVKLDLEADLKEFREDLVTVTQQKEELLQDLGESKNKLLCVNDEIHNLLKSVNELTKKNEESSIKFKKSLEEVSTKYNQLKDEFCVVSADLEREKKEKQDLESIISTVEEKISESEEQNKMLLQNTVETMSKEIEDLRNENVSLKKNLEDAESALATSYSESKVKDELENLKVLHQEEVQKLKDSLKKQKDEAKEAEELLKSVSKIFGNSQEVIEQKIKEFISLQEKYTSLKHELSQEQSMKESFKEKYESLSENLELKEQECSELVEELERLKDQSVKSDSLQLDYLACKNEITMLKQTNLNLEEKILSASKEYELKKQECLELVGELERFKDQSVKSDSLQLDYITCKNEMSMLKQTNLNLEEKILSASKEYELEKQKRSDLDEKIEVFEEYIAKFDSLQSDYLNNMKEAEALRNININLEENNLSASSEFDTVHELVQVLENCEMRATLREEEMQSNLQKLKDELETISTNHEQKCDMLHKLIGILEKCEALASIKIKQFHSTCIEYVEKIMDLEGSVKAKEEIIDALNNDNRELQKNYKNLQASSKKQLQVEMQKFKSEKGIMDTKLADYKKLNDSLKNDLAKLQAEMQKFKSENAKIEGRLTDYKKLNESLKCDLAKIEALKDSLEDENKNLKEELVKTREMPEDKNRSRRTAQKSGKVTAIYEETEETDSNENMKQEKVERKHLRCMNIVTNERDLVQKKDEGSSKTKALKRTSNTNEYKSPEKMALKKLKMHKVSDAENVFSKPENLRINLLKRLTNVNDISLPSPRMTRGRKRLALAKENQTSPRSVRS